MHTNNSSLAPTMCQAFWETIYIILLNHLLSLWDIIISVLMIGNWGFERRSNLINISQRNWNQGLSEVTHLVFLILKRRKGICISLESIVNSITNEHLPCSTGHRATAYKITECLSRGQSRLSAPYSPWQNLEQQHTAKSPELYTSNQTGWRLQREQSYNLGKCYLKAIFQVY